MAQVGARAVTAGLALLLVALVGSAFAAASPVHATAYVPPLPIEVMERPFEPRQLPPDGVHVGTIGLDLMPVPASTPVRIPLAGAFALFDAPVMLYGPSVQPSRLIARFYLPPRSVNEVLMAGFSCTDYRLVDAITGQSFENWQSCDRRVPAA